MENEPHQTFTRKKVKYVFVDAVAFSKRPTESQYYIVSTLNRIVSTVMHSLSIPDDHRILLPTGDGVCIGLLETAAKFDLHVRVALHLLNELHLANLGTQEESKRFEIRIGINENSDIEITDVNGQRNLAGAGVNVAARIMDKADGGQILVSDAVHHELSPNEDYIGGFRELEMVDKHGIKYKVHQLLHSSLQGLNTDAPSALSNGPKTVKKVTDHVAYYLALAIKHEQDSLRINSENPFKTSEIYLLVLLGFLAADHRNKHYVSKFEKHSPHTHGFGDATYDEQYKYYEAQDYRSMLAVRSSIIDAAIYPFKLELREFQRFFEKVSYSTNYLYVNSVGREKLKTDWPTVWNEFELDRL